MKQITTNVFMKVFHDKIACVLCGKKVYRLFAFNKKDTPEICDSCLNATRRNDEVINVVNA